MGVGVRSSGTCCADLGPPVLGSPRREEFPGWVHRAVIQSQALEGLVSTSQLAFKFCNPERGNKRFIFPRKVGGVPAICHTRF